MRELLFRGKRKSDGEWVYGLPCYNIYDDFCIQTVGQNPCCEPIIIQTLGQYTVLTDKNGKKIFEGDIMRNAGNVVEFGVDSFCINGDCPLSLWTGTAIIGNIHDNPELLKGGAE